MASLCKRRNWFKCHGSVEYGCTLELYMFLVRHKILIASRTDVIFTENQPYASRLME